MNFTPHPYQKRAIAWIEDHPRCLLFLDMGLGKSVISLSAIHRLIVMAEAERVLVVAPKRVAESTWSREAEKWDHLDLRVSTVLGTEKQRLAALEAEADVYVTSRDQVVWLLGQAPRLAKRVKGGVFFDMAVIDELTSFKNHAAKRFKALRKLLQPAKRVVGLTGTPTPNGIKDLWGQVCVVDGGARLGRSVTRFRERFLNIVMHNHIPVKIYPKPGAEEEIMGLLGDIALTMRAEDWLSLPPLMERDLPVSLPVGAMRAYRKFTRDYVLRLKGERITAESAGVLVNKLSQYANGAIYTEEGSAVGIHDAKLEMLGEIMESADSPILCFYLFRHDADRIRERYPEARLYEGPGDLDDWNSGRIPLLLAHPASCAYGLNMQQGGHTAVWFSTGWNLELYQQANARLHRQGQRKPVTVFRLIARGTIDERMAEAISTKGRNQANMVKRLAEGAIDRIDRI